MVLILVLVEVFQIFRKVEMRILGRARDDVTDHANISFVNASGASVSIICVRLLTCGLGLLPTQLTGLLCQSAPCKEKALSKP